ncbi:hypothetical protein P3S68_015764 [Capsicum galapagoense]
MMADFDGGLLQCISEVTCENDIKKVPSAPDVSNYLISEDEPSAVNRNKDSLRFDGMADNEVETRLKETKGAILLCLSTYTQFGYVNDGRPFWQHIVSSATGCSDSQYFQELYNYYTTEKAWHLSNPDAEKLFKALRAAGVKLAVVSNFDTQLKPVLRALNCDHWFDAVAVSAEVAWHLCDPDSEKVFKALRAAGVKLAVVSNFDTQLRPVLRALNCDHWFDAVAVSTEVEAEKPNPTIFLKACELLEVNPDDVVHVELQSSQPCWTCFFSEATKHKDGGPLDKEFSNTIVGQSYICPKFEDFDSVLYLKLQEELFFEIKNLKYKGESLCTGKPIALSYLHCWLVTKCWCDLFR